MIEVYELDSLLKKYGLDASKILSKNDTILDCGEYQDIDKTLHYLINELGINSKNIEKCPSIMYFDVDNIRGNYELLIKQGVNISSIETALHILNTEPNILKETYYYVLDNYGKEYINRTTSILKIPVDRVIAIEKILSDKSLILSAACSWNSVDEIEKIIKICKKYNISITGSIFFRTADETVKIVEVCKENNVPITGSVFLRIADEIKEIIEVCRENNIPITGSIFYKTADELEKSIEYVKNMYGEAYLQPLIVNKNVEYLKVVLPYLDTLNVLPIVIKSASILTLTLDEIIDRKEYIEYHNGELVLPNGRFNSIFGMTRANYRKLVCKKEECLRLCKK